MGARAERPGRVEALLHERQALRERLGSLERELEERRQSERDGRHGEQQVQQPTLAGSATAGGHG